VTRFEPTGDSSPTSPALATISTNFTQWHPCGACPTGDI
jgi:hypothetical protein